MFSQLSLVGEEWLVLVGGKKKESRLGVVVVLKEWKWIGIMLGAWSLREILQTLLALVDLAVELRI